MTVGHNAVIHACTLKNRAFVGISATVLDGAVIEEGGMLGAGGLLTPGKVIGRNELWVGAPAKLIRVMSDEERRKFDRNAVVYRELARAFPRGAAQRHLEKSQRYRFLRHSGMERVCHAPPSSPFWPVS